MNNHLGRIFTFKDIGSEDWNATEFPPEDFMKNESKRRQHEQFHNFYLTHSKADLYYYIPVSHFHQYLSTDKPTPFEHVRSLGLFTNRHTIQDVYDQYNEVRINLVCCKVWPIPGSYIQCFGYVCNYNDVKTFKLNFWNHLDNRNLAMKQDEILKYGQKPYYE